MNTSIQYHAAQLPVIAGHEITMDEHGRFNLNTIHRASGSDQNKRPGNWSRTAQAVELIDELESKCSDLSIKVIESRKGKGGGTYAHELLAVSYAGWISPRFQLQVNQVFLDYRMGNLQVTQSHEQAALPNPLTPDHQRGIQKAVARKAQSLPKPVQRLAFSRLYSHLKDRFNVGTYKDIDDSQYTEALGAIQAYELEGELLPPESTNEAVFSDRDLSDLYILLCHVHWIYRHWSDYRMDEALRMLQSPAAAQMCEHMSMADTYKTLIGRAKGELLEESRRRLGLNYGIFPIH